MKKLLIVALITTSISAFASSDRDEIVGDVTNQITNGSIYGWYDDCNGSIITSNGSVYTYNQ